MKTKTKGTLFILSSAICFSLGGLLIKLIPWSATSVSGGRCLFSSAFLALLILVTKHKFIFNKTTFVGAFCVWGSMSLYVLANKLTTAANAIVLQYTAPIFVIIFDFVLFKKKPRKIDLITLIFVAVGVVLVFADGLGSKNLTGDILALISGVCYAVVLLLNEFKNGDSLSSLLMGHVMCLLYGIPSVLGESDFTKQTIIYVLILGVFQAGLGYFCLGYGTQITDPLTSSLLMSIEPILNPILVSIFYHEHMNTLSVFGAAMVIISITLNTIVSNKKRID